MLKKSLLIMVSILFLASLYLHFGHNWEDKTPKSLNIPVLTPSPRRPTKVERKKPLGDFQKEQLVESYLDSSGLWAQLGMPQKILNKHLENPLMAKRLSMDDLEKVKQLIQEKLGVDAISRQVKKQISNSFSPKELQDLLEIFSTPVMKKVASLEEYLSSEDLLVKAGLMQLTTEKSSQRAKLLAHLESIKSEGERSFLITLHSIRGLHQGFARILPKEKRISEKRVKATLAILNKFARPRFKNLALIRYDYAYKDLSNRELREYISISQKKVMLKAQEATLRGIIDSFKAL